MPEPHATPRPVDTRERAVRRVSPDPLISQTATPNSDEPVTRQFSPDRLSALLATAGLKPHPGAAAPRTCTTAPPTVAHSGQSRTAHEPGRDWPPDAPSTQGKGARRTAMPPCPPPTQYKPPCALQPSVPPPLRPSRPQTMLAGLRPPLVALAVSPGAPAAPELQPAPNRRAELVALARNPNAGQAPRSFAHRGNAPATTSGKCWRSPPDSRPCHTVLLSDRGADGVEHPRASSPHSAVGLADERRESQRTALLSLLAALMTGGCCWWLWVQEGAEARWPWRASSASASIAPAIAPRVATDATESRGPLTESAARASHDAASPQRASMALPAASSGAPRSRGAAAARRRIPESRPDAMAAANAIEQLALGHHRQALAAYLQVAQAQPEHPAYATLVRVLQRKLRARCAQRAEAEGIACTDVVP
jgi:hypothetical protein